MLCPNLARTSEGRLTFAGVDVVTLAETYGTPLYLFDEDRIRENCRIYTETMREVFGEGSVPSYAGKAACFRHMYEIMREENMGADLVSCGEICTALHAGYPLERGYFHGNNKTDEDIAYAMDCGVGTFVVDSETELKAISEIASRRGITQKVLLRLTPGIDPHTYAAVATGKVDSKFGVPIETGQAMPFTLAALSMKNIEVVGFHCHVGSQVFDRERSVYPDSADLMLGFCDEVRKKTGYVAERLDLGGGYGVRYTEEDPVVDIRQNIRLLGAHIRTVCAERNYPMPKILLEPGRSIVADAGMTLYRVGAAKEILGYKNYVSVDGGMGDNPRYALYRSKYTVLHATRPQSEADFRCDLVGRYCESDDVIQPEVLLPKPERGDVIAVCTTGAYNYSMASNYNRVPRPAVVMLRGGNAFEAVRRERPEDLLLLDV